MKLIVGANFCESRLHNFTYLEIVFAYLRKIANFFYDYESLDSAVNEFNNISFMFCSVLAL